MSRHSKSEAVCNVDVSAGEEDELAGGRCRNGNWPVFKDFRPASALQINQKKKRRRCRTAFKSRTECLLLVFCLILLTALAIVVAAWAILSDGFSNISDPTRSDALRKGNQQGSGDHDASWPAGTCTTAECARISALFLNNLNTKVSPCDDFYEYACGGFTENYDVPEDKPLVNRVSETDATLSRRLKYLLDSHTGPTSSDDPAYFAKTLYDSCMNEDALRLKDRQPVLDVLRKYGGWPLLDNGQPQSAHGQDWVSTAAWMVRDFGGFFLIEVVVGHDPQNTSQNVIKIDQADLTLETRDFYLNDSDTTVLDAYRMLTTNVALALGADQRTIKQDVDDLITFEKRLAEAHVPDDERRDATRLNNPHQMGNLDKKFPKLRLRRLLDIVFPAYEGFHLSDSDTVILLEVAYLHKLEKIMSVTPPRTVNNYLLWRLIKNNLIALPAKIRDLINDLRSLLLGTAVSQSRTDECIQLLKANLPMIVGYLYVKHYFDLDQRHEVANICKNLKQSFIREVQQLDWMDNTTRQHAVAKAHALKYKVAYPPNLFNISWLTDKFAGTNFTVDGLLDMVVTMKTRMQREKRAMLKEPIDPDYWFESPMMVDAYYVPAKHEMVFPAGILQFPFFNRGAPAYINYAMIGTVISHEITHGFDDEGRRYDVMGNLKNWWDNRTAEQFENMSRNMELQYGSLYVPEAGRQLNGRSTLGENIADNGGVKTAYEAYKQLLTAEGHVDQALPGLQNFTNMQLFFIAYANNWCAIMRPEAYSFLIASDPHAPPRYRTIVPLRNLPQFSQAFNCAANSPMNPPDKVSIW